MDKKLIRAIKEQEKEKSEKRIKDIWHSADGRFKLLIFDLIFDWILFKIFKISSSGTVLDGLPELKEEKKPFWQELLFKVSIAAIVLTIIYFQSKVFR